MILHILNLLFGLKEEMTVSKARGIVLESNNGYSTILMEGGQYIKIRRTMEVGQIYQQERQYQKLLIAIAAVLVFMLLGVFDFFNVVAYANVSNGIEMGVNRWNRVIKIEQTNPVAATPAEYSGLKGRKLEQAVTVVVEDALAEENYQDSSIQVNIKSEKKDDSKLEKEILEKIESSVKADFSIPDNSEEKSDNRNKNSISIKAKNVQQNDKNPGRENSQTKPDNEQNKNPQNNSSIKPSNKNQNNNSDKRGGRD